MTSLTIQAGDAPKIYAFLSDIYGEVLSIPVDDIETFKYSVFRVVSGARIPVDGFVDIDLPPVCYHEEAAPYPDTIVGLSTAEIEKGYNVEVFPYTLDSETNEWRSPFTNPGSQYQLVVTLRYAMQDPALAGTGYINKTFSVRINVGA